MASSNVLVYVDNILVVSDSLDLLSTAKAHIRQKYNMTDFGPTIAILGMDTTHDLSVGTVRLPQEQYTTEILEKYGMPDSNPSTLPMSPTHYRDVDSSSPSDHVALSPADRETFRAILGYVNFLCMCTRHDIAFAINVTSRH
jgi:hypothetical protein